MSLKLLSALQRFTDADRAGATGATLHDGTTASDVTESLEVKGRPEDVRVLVQNADGGFDVTVAFSNTSVSYSGDGTTDVDEQRPVVDNTTVDITISDTTGAANSVDYDILLI